MKSRSQLNLKAVGCAKRKNQRFNFKVEDCIKVKC